MIKCNNAVKWVGKIQIFFSYVMISILHCTQFQVFLCLPASDLPVPEPLAAASFPNSAWSVSNAVITNCFCQHSSSSGDTGQREGCGAYTLLSSVIIRESHIHSREIRIAIAFSGYLNQRSYSQWGVSSCPVKALFGRRHVKFLWDHVWLLMTNCHTWVLVSPMF